MVDQPTLEYVIRTFKSDIEIMSQVEALIPGCMVYVNSFNTRKVRLKHANPEYLNERDEWLVKAPLHAAWLFESILRSSNINFWCRAVTHEIVTPWSNKPEDRKKLEVEGRNLLSKAISAREIKGYVADIATPYQLMGAAWANTRPYVMNVWSCGSGKTLGTIMAVLSRPGDVVVVCPAKARHVWWSQVQEYSTITPFRVKPKAEVRKKDQTFEEYEAMCAEKGQRKFIIVGAE
jgi:hypothetical protein